MKIKADFVTNSSSSSFILILKSQTNDRAEIIRRLSEYLEQRHGDDADSEESGSLLQADLQNLQQSSANEFVLEGAIPYYRDYDDLPKPIRDLVLDQTTDPKGLDQAGIEIIGFSIIDRNSGVPK